MLSFYSYILCLQISLKTSKLYPIMAFGLFKNKKRLLDLRNHDDVELSTRNSAKTSFDPNTGNIIPSSPMINQDSSAPVQSSGSNQSFSGGFDFFGNPINSGNTPSSSSSNSFDSGFSSSQSSSSSFETRINDISDRFSRLLDRIDLLEKKLDRLERRNGVGGY